MGKKSKGIFILQSGEKWREQYLAGTPIDVIALNEKKNRQIISRSIWLAKIPEDLKRMIYDHPDLFTREILIDYFAAKRAQCEQNNFSVLRTEIGRIISEGPLSKPKLKKTNKKRKLNKGSNIFQSPLPDKKIKLNSVFRLDEALQAGFRIDAALGRKTSSTQVVFDQNGQGGELKISFKNDSDLNFIIERLEDFKQNKFNSTNHKNFLGFLEYNQDN